MFGDAYVIPMSDILADIQLSVGAQSVDLPTGLDILSIASTLPPRPNPRSEPRDTPQSQSDAGECEYVPQPSTMEGRHSLTAEVVHEAVSATSADFVQPPSSLGSCHGQIPRQKGRLPTSGYCHTCRKRRIKCGTYAPAHKEGVAHEWWRGY